MDYIVEFVKSKLGKIVLSVFGVLLVIGILYGVFAPTAQEKLHNAQTSVSNLLMESDETVLRHDVTEEDIKQAESAVKRLARDKEEEFEGTVEEAKNQFEVLSVVSSVFEGNPLIGESVPLIKEGVTKEQLAEVQKNLPESDNHYIQKANELLNQAPTMLDEMDALKSEIAQFTDIKTVTRGNLYDVVVAANDITQSAQVYSDQPYMASTRDAYHQSMDNLVATITNGYSYGAYEQVTIDEIFKNPVLSERLKGSPLHPLPLVSLTFDDGPNLEYTPQILDILAENGVKATFFVYGAYVDDHPEMAKRIVDEGHIIANHSYSHPNFSELSSEDVVQEIEWTQESIYDATGVQPSLYRMPFGAGGPRVVRLFPDYTSIIWNLDSLDWHLQDSEAIYQNVMANMSDDSLILMHDTAQYTVDAVARFVPELVEAGYQFVTPMELEFQHRFFAE